MEKRLVMTWNKSQMNAYEDEHDFVEECLHHAAAQIGYMAIMNPDQAFQGVGNELKENKGAETVSLYIKLKVFDVDPTEYLEGIKDEPRA